MKYPHDHENDVLYFGRVNFRNTMQTFGIKTDDRRRHMYVIGKTGMGKTTLLENLFLSDVYAGHGCCYIDPHGDTAEKIIDHIPSWRINDVVYFNPSDLDFPVGFNILESVDPKMKHLVASGLMGVFKKIWEGVWSARMEYIMNNTILALLDTPGSTLLGINRMLSDEPYRTSIIKNIQDPIVKQFWLKEFANYQDKFASEAVAPIQNKVGQFISASIIRNIVAQAQSTIDVREMMDNQKIFIVNLSKGRVGEDASRLLGGMLITKIQMSAMERVDVPESERNDFYLYVDEFQNFAVESFASILSEARKYRLNLIMAHQYIAQLTEEVRDAVFGNVGSIVSFRVGSPDAQFMEDEFMPRFTPEDIINLPKYNIYLKLMIDGVTSQPFSAVTLPPIAHKTHSTQKVIDQSRERYSKPRSSIEANVMKWSGFGDEVNIDEVLDEAKKAKKAAKKAKYQHNYDCTSCGTSFDLPVELDRSRPIYCDDCHPKNKKDNKKNKDHNHDHGRKTKKKIIEKPPNVKDGEIISNAVPNSTIKLSNLKDEPEKQVQSVNGEQDTKKKNKSQSLNLKDSKQEKQDIERKKDNSHKLGEKSDEKHAQTQKEKSPRKSEKLKEIVEKQLLDKNSDSKSRIKHEKIENTEGEKSNKDQASLNKNSEQAPKKKRRRRRRRRKSENNSESNSGQSSNKAEKSNIDNKKLNASHGNKEISSKSDSEEYSRQQENLKSNSESPKNKTIESKNLRPGQIANFD